MSFGAASLSVMVPTRRYDPVLAARLGRLAASHAVDEIVVVEPYGAGTAAPALRTSPSSSAQPGMPLRLLCFLLGADPRALAACYERRRR